MTAEQRLVFQRKSHRHVAVLPVLLLAIGCAYGTDATRTGKGHFDPTDPNDVRILHEFPSTEHTEIGVVTVTVRPGETAKAHNSLREEAARMGGTLVVITASGVYSDGLSTYMYVKGTVVR
jgi:hypothetical protein